MDHTCGHTAHAQPAKFFGDFGADKTQIAHLAQQGAVKLARFVALQKTGFDFFIGKAAHGLGQCLQVFVDVRIRVHRLS